MPNFKVGDSIRRKSDGIKAKVTHIARGVYSNGDKYTLNVEEGGVYPASRTWNVVDVDTFWESDNPLDAGKIQASSIRTTTIQYNNNIAVGGKKAAFIVRGDINDTLLDKIFQLRHVKRTTQSPMDDTLTVETDLSAGYPSKNFYESLRAICGITRTVFLKD